MLTLFSSRNGTACDGTNRRDFLKIGALGLGIKLGSAGPDHESGRPGGRNDDERHQRDRDHQDRPPVVSTVHGRQCRTKVPVVSLPAGCQLLPQELSDFPAADYSRAASV